MWRISITLWRKAYIWSWIHMRAEPINISFEEWLVKTTHFSLYNRPFKSRQTFIKHMDYALFLRTILCGWRCYVLCHNRANMPCVILSSTFSPIQDMVLPILLHRPIFGRHGITKISPTWSRFFIKEIVYDFGPRIWEWCSRAPVVTRNRSIRLLNLRLGHG